MARIAQLSDLHFVPGSHEQAAVLTALLSALARERDARGKFDLLVITGDVFDDGAEAPGHAARSFAALHADLVGVLGDVPSVIVPGNHDRRRMGLFGPHNEELFHALKVALGDRAWVHGCNLPFLADVLPPERHGLPLWLVAYDSTYLTRGFMSAGGMMRQQDLLQAAAIIGDREPDWPILLLLHHHLVPTPITDLTEVDATGRSAATRFGLERLLPWLFSHADREELTMTALGAGTAISTLHTLGRAVIVLHGHKHYATARVLDGTVRGHGDVILVSAGSAGTAQPWASEREGARLWPSFNVLELERDRLVIDTVSFGYKGRSTGQPRERPMLRATRNGAQWHAEPIAPAPQERPRLAHNRARYSMVRSDAFAHRWDFDCEREVALEPGAQLSRYTETIGGEVGAVLHVLSGHEGQRAVPTSLHLSLDRPTRYRLIGGVARALNGLHHSDADKHPPFASLVLMNRYACRSTELVVWGLGSSTVEAFATMTDLGTGLEKPIAAERDGDGAVIVRVAPCPPRTLLRLYWPLRRAGDPRA